MGSHDCLGDEGGIDKMTDWTKVLGFLWWNSIAGAAEIIAVQY